MFSMGDSGTHVCAGCPERSCFPCDTPVLCFHAICLVLCFMRYVLYYASCDMPCIMLHAICLVLCFMRYALYYASCEKSVLCEGLALGHI